VDTISQFRRHLVPTLPGDDDLQFGLEVERFEARRTLLEVLLNLVTPSIGQLAIEKVVQRLDCLLASRRFTEAVRPTSMLPTVFH
jgi:hypothetical protein